MENPISMDFRGGIIMNYKCPVCGYNGLEEMPYDKDGNPSYEICFCCGFEFGFDDESEGISFDEYREKWINEGANWRRPDLKPSNWDIKVQLKGINIDF